ncbi:MAG: hypothetical protein K2X98_02715 [Alphaproteobacteria bacterium]|nr:hypothetical protein [Alphaproteobacteria bacterium]
MNKPLALEMSDALSHQSPPHQNSLMAIGKHRALRCHDHHVALLYLLYTPL